MKTSLPFVTRSLSCLAFAVALATCAHAAVTNVVWYRLGENDPGAASGQVVNTTTIDFVGGKDLRRFGSPRYTNAVLSAAEDQVGSSLAVLFNGVNQFYSNAVVTTARNNFGIEAWVDPTTAPGTYIIAFNGSWGLGTFGSGFTRGAAHVALVRDNGVATLYVNGTAQGSTNVTPATPSSGFTIAALPAPQVGLFPGIIDEVRVFTFAPGQFSTDDLLVNQERVATLAATGFAPGSATLNGSASSFSFDTMVWFEWGTTTNLGNVTPPQALGSGFTTTNFDEVLTGLPAGLTHYFRAVATNDLGIAFGNLRSFAIGPFVETLPATDLTQTSATLNGVANPRGATTTTWFEWGFTTNYGNVTPPQALGNGTSDTNFSASLTGLNMTVANHFRAVASNSFGVVFGADQSFPSLAQRAYIKASNTGASDLFGWSVAMSGDTLVVGAQGESSSATGVNGDGGNNSAAQSGAAYVFVRNGDSWVQQAYLKASNTEQFDDFGYSVAMSGDCIVVGAWGEASGATGVNGGQNSNSAGQSGAAYVFGPPLSAPVLNIVGSGSSQTQSTRTIRRFNSARWTTRRSSAWSRGRKAPEAAAVHDAGAGRKPSVRRNRKTSFS